jgi:hypothetical protein
LETRNPGATWWIPSEDEWYKAAYYDPTLNGGTGGYWSYPTRSNATPGNVVGSGSNEANYFNGVYAVTQSSVEAPAQNYLTAVGAFTRSASHYGTYDQGGDVYQWNEAVEGSARGVRGGQWGFAADRLQSSNRESRVAVNGNNGVGFRVASGMRIPPGNFTLLLSATDPGPAVPEGIGFGALTVGPHGGVIVAGRLPDGETFHGSGLLASGTAGVQLSASNALSYPSVQTVGTKGSLVWNLNFAAITGTSDFNGTVEWMKPAQKSGAYPAAIDTSLTVIGSRYKVASSGSVLPGFTGGTLELSDTGALSVSGTPLEQGVTLSSSNTFKLMHPIQDQLQAGIRVSDGVFAGSFLYPGQNQRTDFRGVLFQDQVIGEGFFLGPAGSGTVTLAPPP